MIRRILNFPTKSQKELLKADTENVLKKCKAIAKKEYSEQLEARESHDSVCPNCRKRKDNNNIVNKIRQIQGKGDVHGSFKLGFGTVNGYMEIDTKAVNHCNSCGHEWEKFKVKYVSESDIVRVALNYLGSILRNPEEKKYKWKLEAIEVFENCYAETIIGLRDAQESFLFMTTMSKLRLYRLRRYYKSVFDVGERKLEKI